MNLEKEVFDLAISDIMPNRFQPREVFDEESINELATSIKEHGVIQPIIVRKIGDKYEIVAGERRYRASQVAGNTTIPALIRNIDDKESAKIALLENLQRKNLTAIEEARTYQTILKLDNLTQEELANDLGKSQSAIANKLRLLNLDEEVQTALLNGQISERHARSLLNLDDKTKQKEMLNKIITNRMTVKQVDDEIAIITGKNVEILEDEAPTIKNNGNLLNENEIKNQPVIDTNIFAKQSNVQNDNLESIISVANPISTIEETDNSNGIFDSTIEQTLIPDINQNSPIANINANIGGESPIPGIQPLPEEPVSELPQDPLIIPNNINSINDNISGQTITSEISPINEIPPLPKADDINSSFELFLKNYKDVMDNPDESNLSVPSEQLIQTESVQPINNEINEFVAPSIPTIPQGTINNSDNLYANLNKVNEIVTPSPQPIINQPIQEPSGNSNDIYDLRFAINNFRQAVQNTEKFGFNIDVEEFDFDNTYQIVVKINKNKQKL